MAMASNATSAVAFGQWVYEASPFDQGHASSVGAILCSLIMAAVGRFILKGTRFPPVLVFLLSGMMVNAYFPGTSFRNLLTKPFMDVSLAAIGLQIGSHLNEEVLGVLWLPVMKFVICLMLVLLPLMTGVAQLLYPAYSLYAPLVACIALERSSPEAMAGIRNTGAKGPFSSTTMSVSAVLDVVALVAFVCTATFIEGKGYGPIVFLLRMLLGTAITVLAVVLAVSVAQERRNVPPIVMLIAALFIIVACHKLLECEVLLAAVIAGTLLNYRGLHPITTVVEENELLVNVTLFTLLGLRISAVGYVIEIGPILVLYCARLVGLYLGSLLGGAAAGSSFTSFRHVRWMGLVTQLAIALSLVTRAEERFPGSGALARAYGGAVLLNIVTGPPLLVWVLGRVGEARGALAAAHHHDDDAATSA